LVWDESIRQLTDAGQKWCIDLLIHRGQFGPFWSIHQQHTFVRLVMMTAWNSLVFRYLFRIIRLIIWPREIEKPTEAPQDHHRKVMYLLDYSGWAIQALVAIILAFAMNQGDVAHHAFIHGNVMLLIFFIQLILVFAEALNGVARALDWFFPPIPKRADYDTKCEAEKRDISEKHWIAFGFLFVSLAPFWDQKLVGTLYMIIGLLICIIFGALPIIQKLVDEKKENVRSNRVFAVLSAMAIFTISFMATFVWLMVDNSQMLSSRMLYFQEPGQNIVWFWQCIFVMALGHATMSFVRVLRYFVRPKCSFRRFKILKGDDHEIPFQEQQLLVSTAPSGLRMIGSSM